MQTKDFDPKKDLVFNLKVVEACRSCKRYGLVGCCPPNIGTFEYYKKLLKKYTYGKIFIEKFVVDDPKNWKEIGRTSSLELHKVLLKEKDNLFNKGHYFSIALGGGSCKQCKECSVPCKFPQFRIIPIEGTGIDVVETLNKLGMFIHFPVKKFFYRCGVILYD
jgi:predicted metal-binding protein